MPLTPSPSNLSGLPAQNFNIPQLDSSTSDNDEQDDQDTYMSDNQYSQDSFSPLDLNDVNEVDVQGQDAYLDEYEEDIQAEVTVPDQDTSGSAPEISLTDEDLNYLDEFFDKIGAVGGNVDGQEIVSSPSDQDPEEYVRQFTPEHVPEQDREEEEQDDNSQLINYLRTFSYIQNSQPRRNDIIYYYDTDEGAFVKVRIISKSNYRFYYNIQYLEVDRPNGGV